MTNEQYEKLLVPDLQVQVLQREVLIRVALADLVKFDSSHDLSLIP